MPKVAIEDGEICYEETGAGYPLILVSGLNGVGRYWQQHAAVRSAVSARPPPPAQGGRAAADGEVREERRARVCREAARQDTQGVPRPENTRSDGGTRVRGFDGGVMMDRMCRVPKNDMNIQERTDA